MTKSVMSEGRQATVSYLLDIYVVYFSDHDKFQNVIVKICIAHIVKICIAHKTNRSTNSVIPRHSEEISARGCFRQSYKVYALASLRYNHQRHSSYHQCHNSIANCLIYSFFYNNRDDYKGCRQPSMLLDHKY